MLQFRYLNFPDQRYYNPDRDIGHLLPNLLKNVFGKVEKLQLIKNKYPYLYSLFQSYPLSVEDFTKIAESVGKFVVLTLKDKNIRTATEAMEKSGFSSLSDPAFVIFLSILGMAILDIFFIAIREKYAIGEFPRQLKDYVEQILD